MAFVGIGGWTACLSAQTITIRLLNARTGKPIDDKLMTLDWGSFGSIYVALNKQGAGTVQVPAGSHEFSFQDVSKKNDDAYGYSYFNCNEPPTTNVPVSLVLDKGFVAQNSCSQKTAIVHPGEAIFWISPKPWWMPYIC
jgi:hypothetical protein